MKAGITMGTDGSITRLIEQVQDGDERAAQAIFDKYFERLLQVAKKNLAQAPRGAEDEEDAVISALKSFFHRGKLMQFPQLNDRRSLWALLFRITERKAINQRHRQLAEKRGGGKVLDDQALESCGTAGLHNWAGRVPEPTADTLVGLREQCHDLLQRLPNDSLRHIVRRKLEGHTNAYIASELGVVERTVERKLNLIRQSWSAAFEGFA